jgi:hypothetical protein
MEPNDKEQNTGVGQVERAFAHGGMATTGADFAVWQ